MDPREIGSEDVNLIELAQDCGFGISVVNLWFYYQRISKFYNAKSSLMAS
jgi:hypothetical protein